MSESPICAPLRFSVRRANIDAANIRMLARNCKRIPIHLQKRTNIDNANIRMYAHNHSYKPIYYKIKHVDAANIRMLVRNRKRKPFYLQKKEQILVLLIKKIAKEA